MLTELSRFWSIHPRRYHGPGDAAVSTVQKDGGKSLIGTELSCLPPGYSDRLTVAVHVCRAYHYHAHSVSIHVRSQAGPPAGTFPPQSRTRSTRNSLLSLPATVDGPSPASTPRVGSPPKVHTSICSTHPRVQRASSSFSFRSTRSRRTRRVGVRSVFLVQPARAGLASGRARGAWDARRGGGVPVLLVPTVCS